MNWIQKQWKRLKNFLEKGGKQELPVPVPGEKWQFYYPDDGSPWASKGASGEYVEILDVKDGWVRYSMGKGVVFTDERSPLDTFRRLYRPVGSAGK